MMKCVLFGLLALCADARAAELKITTPIPRIVYQRDGEKAATFAIAGTCPAEATRLEARLTPRVADQGTATEWVALDEAPRAGTFHGTLRGRGGWYDLHVRAFAGAQPLGETTLERVGIGEVFIVVGHSVAAGQRVNLDPPEDDRVNTVPLEKKSPAYQSYINSGDPKDLPEPGFAHYGRDVQPSPFGEGTYFWARFGELIAQREKVPVLIYNAAFGGTSLEHWAKSARGERFEHTFVKSAIRMPYINLRNTLSKYVPLTGVRAILADQGQNDWPNKDEAQVFGYYDTWVRQARADLGFPELAIVVNRQTPFLRDTAIRHVQERMIATPHCFAGPDYDQLAPEDRPDSIHLGASGCAKAATMWVDALNAEFFKSAQPFLAPAASPHP
jgi:hypothetical protein